MSPLINYLLLIFLALFGLFVIIEFITSRDVKKFVIQFVAILLLVVLLRLITGFPIPVARTAFGGFSPVIAIIIMFIGTLIGIAAHYFFYLRGKFYWRKFLKPFVISPIILLPLIGSVQQTSEIEIIQLISFGVLSFQNGFFWKEVLEHAKERM
jgi:predicted permease